MRVSRPALLLALLANTANAADVVIAGVHSAQPAQRDAQLWQEAIAAAVVAAGHTPHLINAPEASAQLARSADTLVADAILGHVRHEIATASALIARGEPNAAQALLTTTISQTQRAMRIVTSVQDLARAWAWCAAARLRSHDMIGARDALATAVGLVPAHLPYDTWPADLLALDEQVRKFEQREHATVSISTDTTSSASIRLDGIVRGAAPITLTSIPLGTHYVHARTGDNRVGYAVFDVIGGHAITAHVALTPPTLYAVAQPDDTVRALYKGVLNTLHGEIIFIVGETPQAWQIQALHADGGLGTPQSLPASPQATQAIQQAVSAAVAAPTQPNIISISLPQNTILANALLLPSIPLTTAQVSTSVPHRPHDPATPHKLKWPAWLGIGLGIAAASAIGTTLGVLLPRRSGPTSQPTPTHQGTVIIVPPGTP